jgi:hypothetical protein
MKKYSEAKVGQFPWQTALRVESNGGQYFKCGGSIINQNWVLTAAHCLTDMINGEFSLVSLRIIAGSLKRKFIMSLNNAINNIFTPQTRFADCVIKHENWTGFEGGFANDIALVRIPFNNSFDITYKSGGYVNGICLPPKTKPPFEPTGTARISGWGVTQEGKSSTVLKYTDVGLIDNQKCSVNNFPFQIIPSMLCQGIDRTSPCYGDSGGPLVMKINNEKRYTQVGIVSTGPQVCANEDEPNGIYTKVSHFVNWIEDNIKSNDKKCECTGKILN